MIRIKPSHKGELRRELHEPKGKDIAVNKLRAIKRKAKRGGNKKLLEQATFALNARGWRKG